MENLHESAAAAEVVPLSFPFQRGGYCHVLLARAGRVCLVERTSTRRWSRGAVHYEVVRLKLERERHRDAAGRWTDTGRRIEHYPSPTRWGRDGWTIVEPGPRSLPTRRSPRERVGHP